MESPPSFYKLIIHEGSKKWSICPLKGFQCPKSVKEAAIAKKYWSDGKIKAAINPLLSCKCKMTVRINSSFIMAIRPYAYLFSVIPNSILIENVLSLYAYFIRP